MLTKSITSLILSFACVAAFADTVPGKQAAKIGFKSCHKTVEKIAKYVVNEGEHGAISTWNNKTPDSRIFNSQVVRKYTDGHSLVILNIAPIRDGKCDATYTSMFEHNKSCNVLRETSLKNWKFYQEVGGLVSLENSEGTVSTILMPIKNGCMTIMTEVVYE